MLTQRFVKCTHTGGVDFPIATGEGYVVQSHTDLDVSLISETMCSDLNIEPGINLLGHPAPPSDLTCYGLLDDLASGGVVSIQRFNQENGMYLLFCNQLILPEVI